jgi:DnaK suppressor protein
MKHLTSGQRALLESSLQLRQAQLDRRLSEHHGGQSRAEHAHDVLQQDGDDAPQREGEREMDMALSDLETQELGAVSQALARLAAEQYGACADCAADIPFDRLKAEPWALRCVACEGALEARAARRGGGEGLRRSERVSGDPAPGQE